jgi:8-oxo-dGTP pyrophosphatase MutT (NUDIX family)
MARTEYYDDPNAPKPNSLVPAATVFVQDDHGRVLMVQRSDNGLWALPGGTMDVGETLSQCAEREVLEETGYRVKVVDVIGIYSDPKHVIAYSDGEVRQQFAISFRALLLEGTSQSSEETPEVSWVGPVVLDEVRMHPSTRLRVHHGLERLPHVHLG